MSNEEAIERARARTNEMLERFRQGISPDRYPYSDRPLREEILEEWKTDSGEANVAITRNAGGCRVLNTADIMFVDVDLAEPSELVRLILGLKSLFGGARERRRDRRMESALSLLRTVVRQSPQAGVRVYRTRGGLRYLFTHTRALPHAETSLGLMKNLGADPRYIRMCKMQESYRARLTPKPWRCGLSPLTVRYPWVDEAARARMRRWVDAYDQTSARFATCDLIDHLGNQEMQLEIARLVKYHDETTKVGSGMPLA